MANLKEICECRQFVAQKACEMEICSVHDKTHNMCLEWHIKVINAINAIKAINVENFNGIYSLVISIKH